MKATAKRSRQSAMDAYLEAEAERLRASIDSNPGMSDQEFFKIVALLKALEPPRPAPTPSAALSREARVTLLGSRFDAGQELWCRQDAIHQHSLTVKTERVETALPDGSTQRRTRAAILDAEGSVISLGKFWSDHD